MARASVVQYAEAEMAAAGSAPDPADCLFRGCHVSVLQVCCVPFVRRGAEKSILAEAILDL